MRRVYKRIKYKVHAIGQPLYTGETPRASSLTNHPYARMSQGGAGYSNLEGEDQIEKKPLKGPETSVEKH